jgi:predicted PhzF superfamily epimerase YddE/YHI9
VESRRRPDRSVTSQRSIENAVVTLPTAESTTLNVVRVFLAADDGGGNLLGIFLRGEQIAGDRRQEVARELGFSETVFFDAIDGPAAVTRIFTPSRELRFAGHPTVGTSWLLRQEGRGVSALRVLAGDVRCWQDGELAWIRARPEWVHDIDVQQLPTAAAVEALDPANESSRYVWAWVDEPTGILRSRYFANDVGIREDEATGAAAVLMGGRLGRDLLIRQGRGSELHVRIGPDGTVDVGGRVARVEERDFPTPP